jgi:glucose-1-phosphate thymidylyltransferase
VLVSEGEIIKGVILAGGTGTRLKPMTIVTNKHLLPVHDKPMIFYPLNTLIEAGVKDILIVTGKEHAGGFLELLGSGKEFGVRFTYRLQDEAGGIAQALGLAEDFVGGQKFIVVLGDNVFEDNIRQHAEDFKNDHGAEAHIFLKEVPDAHRFGVAELDHNQHVTNIEEKPKIPKSNLAVTGLYMYSPNVFELTKNMKPSARGELEITDVNNFYVKRGTARAKILKGFWSDAGTIESLFRATTFAREKKNTTS